jgi:large conductance mechanosensitive channel
LSFFQDFKAFAMRGNVVDLAIAVVIGGAFGAVVNSLVNDIIMPPVGKITGGLDFREHFIALDGGHYATLEAAKKATAVIAYGSFVNSVINFLIIAFAIFMTINQLKRLHRAPPPPPPPGPTPEQVLLTEIRDLLAASAKTRPIT